MGLVLEILEGSNTGTQIPAREGAQIGKSVGSWPINDPQMADFQAEIQKSNNDRLVCVDVTEGEGNLKINGRLVKRISLLPGVRFYICSTPVKVVEVDEEFGIEPIQIKLSSKDYVCQAFQNIRGENLNNPPKIFTLKNSLCFEFIEGILADRRFTISYCPREMGYRSLDLNIDDPNCPEKCFEIIPLSGGDVGLKNLCGSLANINNKDFDLVTLKTGDIITLHTNKIRVFYVE